MGETKEVAKKYFPELFDEDDHLLFNRASILKDIYTLHFSNRSGNFSNSEINLINNGYNYIENAKKTKSKARKLFNKPYQFQELYITLLNDLKEYRFSDNVFYESTGYNQNKTSDNITKEITNFNGAILPILKKVDTFVDSVKNNNECSTYEIKLLSKLVSLAEELNSLHLEINEAKKEYHYSWSSHKYNVGVSNTEVGTKKRIWKKTRNKLCHTIINFIKEMCELNIVMYYESFDYSNTDYGLDSSVIEQYSAYNKAHKNVLNSKNYYCYLDDEEKKEIQEEKIQMLYRRKNNC